MSDNVSPGTMDDTSEALIAFGAIFFLIFIIVVYTIRSASCRERIRKRRTRRKLRRQLRQNAENNRFEHTIGIIDPDIYVIPQVTQPAPSYSPPPRVQPTPPAPQEALPEEYCQQPSYNPMFSTQ